MEATALVVGATGIVGSALSDRLVARGWTVLGLARRPGLQDGVTPIAANLVDRQSLSAALEGAKPTHVFLTSWSRQETEAANIRVNGAMVRNVLEAVRTASSVRHVALVTGLKHYLGPFEAFAKGDVPTTPFREDQGRLDVENFYYAQEDEVFAAAAHDGFTWSVHRPSTMIGKAPGNAMNMGTTLAVYASICRETGRPFLFPGSQTQWDKLSDLTDARLLAEHLEWASTDPLAANEAYNVVNGDVIRWAWMWERIAEWFELPYVAFDGVQRPLESQMASDRSVWHSIAGRNDLAEPDFDRLSTPWHTDADLGRPIEVVTDMSKSRRKGFLSYKPTDDAFFDLFKTLRADRLIP